MYLHYDLSRQQVIRASIEYRPVHRTCRDYYIYLYSRQNMVPLQLADLVRGALSISVSHG